MPKDCRDTALSYLEHKGRSSFEIKSHLKSKGFQEKEIEEELIYLRELNLVDDERYCQDYIRYSTGKGRGPVRIQIELKEKGIDPELIQNALEENFDRQAEKQAALKEAQKILGAGSKFYGTESDTADDDRVDYLEDEFSENSERERNRPDEKTIGKIGRKLSSLGYHPDVIYDIIGQLRKS